MIVQDYAEQTREVEATAAYRVVISQATHDPAWDAFLAQTPGGHHMQTSVWSQVEAMRGWAAVRVIVSEGQHIVGGVQLLTRPVPMPLPQFLQPLLKPLMGTIGQVVMGPLVADNNPAVIQLVFDTIFHIAKKHRIRYLIMQPPYNGEALAQHLVWLGFQPSLTYRQMPATILLDLHPDIDSLFANMRKKHRQYVRQSIREGVTVREGTKEDVPAFYRIHKMTAERQDFKLAPLAYYLGLWDILSPHGYVKLLLSEYQGETITAELMLAFGDATLLLEHGWAERRDIRTNERAYWEAIAWSKSNSYRWCDLNGLDPEIARTIVNNEPVTDEMKHNWSFFKLGFGGSVILLPDAYDYIINPVIRWIYHKIPQKLQELVFHQVVVYARNSATVKE
jgi:lipid II:glycine glycyltransferase (peptidoglycan interpeptide bridge formation enzyme)